MERIAYAIYLRVIEFVKIITKAWSPHLVILRNRVREVPFVQCTVAQLGTALSFSGSLDDVERTCGKFLHGAVTKAKLDSRVFRDVYYIFSYSRIDFKVCALQCTELSLSTCSLQSPRLLSRMQTDLVSGPYRRNSLSEAKPSALA